MYSNVTPPTLPSYDSVANPYYLIQFEYALGAENWETVRFWFGAAPLTWNGSAVTNAVAFSLFTYGTGSPEWTAWGVMAEAGEMALTPGPTTADTYMRLYTNHDILDGTGAVWLAEGTVTPTEEDKEAERMIRIKSQLAGIIAAWCAPVRQFPKPTAEPVAFLYNGVGPLPGLPVVEGFDFAAIAYLDADGVVSGGRAAWLILSTEPIWTHNGFLSDFKLLGNVLFYGFANDDWVWRLVFSMSEPYPPINEWAKIGEGHYSERTAINDIASGFTPIWANHAVYYEGHDFNWPAESDPVPVYEKEE